ncbi:MAG: STAS domain-containing protein [Chloroflexota bacterium]|nr:STAS domain-containing protein [Chloroflexota bacterium]MBI5703552.1 STAS domain-containing protein [Chloroflexota bacterium]
MTIAVEVQGATARIHLSGGIDYASQEEFKRANQQALSVEGVREICVDFAHATFLDSSGIRALLDLQKRADAAGRALVLVNCNSHLREIFEIGGFDKVFRFG